METEERKVRSFTGRGNLGLSVIGVDKETGNQILLDKRSPKMKFWGSLDIVNSFLGTIDSRDFNFIQDNLAKIMGMIYEKPSSDDVDWLKREIGKLERFCRKYENNMPDKFVRPKGKVHYARALVRQAELIGWDYAADILDVDGIKYIMRYMNILSSYLYVYAEGYAYIDED